MSLRVELVRQFTALGWGYTTTRGSHLRWTHPHVPGCIHTSFSPSCSRGVKNAVATARRLMRQHGVLQ